MGMYIRTYIRTAPRLVLSADRRYSITLLVYQYTKLRTIVLQRFFKTPACPWLPPPPTHTHTHTCGTHCIVHARAVKFTHTHAHNVQHCIYAFSVYNTHCTVQTLLTIPPSPRALCNPHTYYTTITLFSPHTQCSFIINTTINTLSQHICTHAHATRTAPHNF